MSCRQRSSGLAEWIELAPPTRNMHSTAFTELATACVVASTTRARWSPLRRISQTSAVAGNFALNYKHLSLRDLPLYTLLVTKPCSHKEGRLLGRRCDHGIDSMTASGFPVLKLSIPNRF